MGDLANRSQGQDPEGLFEIPMQGMGSSVAGRAPGLVSTRCFGASGGKKATSMKRSDGRAVPLLALAAMDASLRQACRYRVSSYRRRETQELHVIGHAELGWDLTPCWPTSPRSCRKITLLLSRRRWRAATGPRTNGDDASGGRRWCSGRRRRGGAANGRGRPDTAKPTTACQLTTTTTAGPLLAHPQPLQSPLEAHYWLVFGPERIGQLVRYVGRYAYRAPNSVEEGKAKVLQGVEDRSRGESSSRRRTSRRSGLRSRRRRRLVVPCQK